MNDLEREEFKRYLSERTESNGFADQGRTHITEILRMIKRTLSGFVSDEAVVLSDTSTYRFTFADGRRYSVSVREVRE